MDKQTRPLRQIWSHVGQMLPAEGDTWGDGLAQTPNHFCQDEQRGGIFPLMPRLLATPISICHLFFPQSEKCANIWALAVPEGLDVYSGVLLDFQEFTDPKSLISSWLTVAAAEIQLFRYLNWYF